MLCCKQVWYLSQSGPEAAEGALIYNITDKECKSTTTVSKEPTGKGM